MTKKKAAPAKKKPKKAAKPKPKPKAKQKPKGEEKKEVASEPVAPPEAPGIRVLLECPKVYGTTRMNVRCTIKNIAVSVEHAFGESAKYKTRDVKGYLDLVPQNAQVLITVPCEEIESGIGAGVKSSVTELSDFVQAVFDRLALGVEVVVDAAEEREGAKGLDYETIEKIAKSWEGKPVLAPPTPNPKKSVQEF